MLFAIIRQESSFDPSDWSHAQAMGLMQVTPEAGRDTAKRFGISYDWDRMVSDPVYNTQMGAAELSANITEDRILYAETTYTLTNWVHVSNNKTLTIRPGTTIKGRTGSALFIMRGSKIMAEGRADAPIVFTSDQPVGQRKPGDWGGLIILGNGQINRAGVVDLEGTGSGGAQNPAIDYGGGTNNADNSGVLRYVRVEFAGVEFSPDNELNGIAFQGVGRGGSYEYIQIHMNRDDGLEWFGGTADIKHAVASNAADALRRVARERCVQEPQPAVRRTLLDALEHARCALLPAQADA